MPPRSNYRLVGGGHFAVLREGLANPSETLNGILIGFWRLMQFIENKRRACEIE